MESSAARQRKTLALMITAQTVLIAAAVGAGSWIALSCGVLANLGALLSDRRRFELNPARWASGLALFFILKLQLFPVRLPLHSLFLRSESAHELASYLVALQTVMIWRRTPDNAVVTNGLPNWIAGLSGIGLIVAATLRDVLGKRWLPAACVILFLAAWTEFARASRRRSAMDVQPHAKQTLGKWLIYGSLVFSLSSGAVLAALYVQHEHQLEAWILEAILGEGAGEYFDSTGLSSRSALRDISSYKQHQSARIALRVESETVPWYLRGRVFDHYENAYWTSRQSASPLGRIPREAERNQDQRVVYSLRPLELGPVRRMEVWPEQMSSLYFSTLETRRIRSAEPLLLGDAQGAIFAKDLGLAGESYTLLNQRRSATPLSADLRKDCLQSLLRPSTTALVKEKAETVFAGCASIREKIEAVETYFRSHYQYRIGIHFPREEEPLEYFLREQPPGHCELFASASVILLREAGIPARYVTGFVCAERNSLGEYWVSRNRDAHAWAEAYDDEQQQWLLVEATPAAGIPHVEPVSAWDAYADASRQLWNRLWKSFREASQNPNQRLGIIVFLMVPLLAILGRRWRSRRATKKRTTVDPTWMLTPALAAARLKAADAMMSQVGLIRGVEETVTQFAARIRRAPPCPAASSVWLNSLADWYLSYAGCRFRPTVSAAEWAALGNPQPAMTQGRENR